MGEDYKADDNACGNDNNDDGVADDDDDMVVVKVLMVKDLLFSLWYITARNDHQPAQRPLPTRWPLPAHLLLRKQMAKQL